MLQTSVSGLVGNTFQETTEQDINESQKGSFLPYAQTGNNIVVFPGTVYQPAESAKQTAPYMPSVGSGGSGNSGTIDARPKEIQPSKAASVTEEVLPQVNPGGAPTQYDYGTGQTYSEGEMVGQAGFAGFGSIKDLLTPKNIMIGVGGLVILILLLRR